MYEKHGTRENIGGTRTPNIAKTKEGDMPFSTREDLPQNVRNVLPPHAQDIYKEAFNNASDEYESPKDRKKGGSREEAAHRVAWSAVKQKYAKGQDDKWHPSE